MLHYNEEDEELVQVLKQVSKALPVCAMKDESAIFIKDGVAEIIGQIFLIDNEEIAPVTENILAKLINYALRSSIKNIKAEKS